jgi:hypothetical protein
MAGWCPTYAILKVKFSDVVKSMKCAYYKKEGNQRLMIREELFDNVEDVRDENS